jgi:hypothetical protein
MRPKYIERRKHKHACVCLHAWFGTIDGSTPANIEDGIGWVDLGWGGSRVAVAIGAL